MKIAGAMRGRKCIYDITTKMNITFFKQDVGNRSGGNETITWNPYQIWSGVDLYVQSRIHAKHTIIPSRDQPEFREIGRVIYVIQYICRYSG